MAFKVNDRILVTGLKVTGKYEKTVGKCGIIKRTYVDKKHRLTYGVTLDDLTNDASKDGLFWFGKGEIEIMPTLQQIKEERMDCVIHTPTKEDIIYILNILDYSTLSLLSDKSWVDEAFKHEGDKLCLHILQGRIYIYDNINYFRLTPTRYPHIYEAKDLFETPNTEQSSNCTNSCTFKVGDRVRIKEDLPKCEQVNKVYVNISMYMHRGEEATITRVNANGTFQLDIKHCTHYVWNSEMVDLIYDISTYDISTNIPINIPTLSNIVKYKLTCIIHTPRKEQVEKLFSYFTEAGRLAALSCWKKYREDTCYYIEDGTNWRYNSKQFYMDRSDKYPIIYEFEDIISASNSYKSDKPNNIKEEKKMNKTFEVIKGTRPNTNKGETGYIDTITTIAYTPRGESYVTCDASDYDAYTGALVASAKIVAKNNNNASIMYNTAMELWGTDISKSILHALANKAFKGYFDNRYYRWRKTIFYQERLTEKSTRTCPICGEVFKTIEEKEKHIKWHEECKAHREAKKIERKERREAQRRIAEIQSEGRIEQYMKEITSKEKTVPVEESVVQEDNSTTDNTNIE